MAENTIDSLDIRVSSTTTKAVSALENLQKKLGGVNNAFRQLNGSGLRNYTRDVNRFTASLISLNKLKINVTKFSELNAQLQQLSNIDLKNLQNKKISLDIEVTGGDAQKKLRASLEQALRETKVDTSGIAKNLAESFNISSKEAVSQMKSILNHMSVDLAKTWDGQNVDFTKDNKFIDGLEKLAKVVAENARIVQSKMGIYDQFFAYFKNKKIYISDALKDAMGNDLFNEIKNANIGQIVRDATKGIDISSIWDEMADLFPEHISRDITNQVDQIVQAFSVLKKARQDIEHTISFKDLSAENQADLTDEIYSKIIDSASKLPQVIQSNIKNAIQTASQQVDLDININQGKIIGDIRAAIKAASKVTYDAVDIKLDVNTDNIKDEISKKIKSLNQNNLPEITKALQEFANTMTALNNVDLKDTGITTVTNALKRLLAVDMSKFDSNGFQVIANSISSLATLPDISSTLNRFISSFSRLATAGAKVSTTTVWLPKLGQHLRDITAKMVGVGEINASVGLFVQSLARLASAGKKTGDTASNLEKLGDEVLKFFKTMQKAPKISEDTIRMTEALSKLASAGGNVGKSTNSVSQAMNRLSKTSSNASNLIKKSMSKIVSAFKSIGNVTPQIAKANSGVMTLLKSVSLMGIFYKAFSTVKESITLGSDLTEVGNVVEVTFGEMANDVYKFAEIAKHQFGLSQLAAQQYAGTMMGMLKSAKVATNTAAEMSVTLAGLAGDYASFWNVSTDEAFKAIRSGLSGETEPLRRFGKDMTVATLEAYALSQGITKAYSSMTYSEKVLLRYNYLLSASGNEMGDFARTANTFANQTRILTNNIKDLLTYIGQGFIAAVRPAVIVLNVLMTKLIQVAKVFRSFMYTLTGYKGEGSQGGIVDDLAGVGDMYDDISGIGGAGDDAADGLDDATDSAKELKKALSVLPFDQLNQLSSAAKDTSKDLGGIGSIGGIGDLGLGDLDTSIGDIDSSEIVEKINKWAEDIRNAFLDKDWDYLGMIIAGGLNNGLEYLYDVISWKNVGPKITSFIHAFASTFNSFTNYFDWKLLGRTVGAGVNTVVNTLNGLLTKVDWKQLGFGFSTSLMGIFEEIDWANLGQLFSNGFNSIVKTIYGFLDGLKPTTIGLKLGIFIKSGLETINFDLLSLTVTNGINTIIESMKAFIDEQPFSGLSSKLSKFVNNVIKNVNWHTLGAVLGLHMKRVVGGISDFIKETDFNALGASIGAFLKGMDWVGIVSEVGRLGWEAIKAAFETWKSSFDTAPIETAIITALGLLKFTGLGSLLGHTLWSKIRGSILAPATTTLFKGKIKDGVQKTITDAVTDETVVSSVGNSGSALWNAMFEGFQPALAQAGVLIGIASVGIQIQQMSDIAKGGNGILTDYGGLLDSIANNSAPAFAQRLFEVKEELENQGASIDEVKTRLVEFFTAEGISADQLITMVNDVGGSINLTTEQIEIMEDVIKQLPETAKNSEDSFVAMKDALVQLQQDGVIPSNDHMESLLTTLDKQQQSGSTASDAWLALTQQLEDMSISVDDVVKILGIDFINTLSDVSDSAETTAKEVDTSMKNASSSVASSSSDMAKDVTKNLGEIDKATETSFGNVESTSDKKWSAADLSVEDALKLMHSATSKQMRNIYKNVESYTNSIYNITTNNWSALSLRVSQLMDEMNTAIVEKLETTKSLFNNFGNDITGRMNLYNAGRTAAQSFANGFKSVYIPTPHMRIASWRQHNLPNGGMMQSPVFEVNWYKSGGLFNGASVIGVGEAGREAVLPLENRRTMRMIADSIVSNAGNGFMDESTMINAVAAGVSMAMSNVSFDSGSNEVVIMIDGREVARAVNKANERSGYRNNP